MPEVRQPPPAVRHAQPEALVARSTDLWEQCVSEKFLPLAIEPLPATGGFEGRSLMTRFCDSVVGEVLVGPHRVMRTRRLVADAKARYIKIYWQLGGYANLEQGGRDLIIQPGQWTIYDTSVPYRFDTSEFSHFMTLLLPQSEAGHWVPQLENLFGTVLPAQGTAEIARAALGGLLRDGVTLETDGQLVMQDSILALMSASIRQFALNQPASGQRPVSRRLERALAYIEQHLVDPDLSTDTVANACGMSRRTLYTAFDHIGQTPHAYILAQRLDLARRLLGESGTRRKITEVAYEVGFADAAHFSRAFLERFKVTPSHWRASRATV
ncbi:helix-turn-helix domain-containing protein (plasmid) [Paraburkholderia sp. PREW-6R]|uniref:helix-turn-helix domain-containing protein n=1 Tax=Paraburkholderia sp. PREW-6R TaxID=3141544 RepID=UPI0031F4F41E